MKGNIVGVLFFLSLVLVSQNSVGQSVDYPIEFWFWPDYTLPGRASNYPGPRLEKPAETFTTVKAQSTPIIFYQQAPTNRLVNFIDVDRLPKKSFSIEMWMVNHVNQPIGVLVAQKQKFLQSDPDWLLGLYEGHVHFSLKTEGYAYATELTYDISKGWKKYWAHLVATYDGAVMKLYVNGELVNEAKVSTRASIDTNHEEIEVASYMLNEPYMQTGDLLKSLRIYDKVLSKKEVNQRQEELQNMVVKGKLYPDLFHFNAGPYLNYSTETSINMVWETDRPAQFVIAYGKDASLKNQVEVNTQKIDTETKINDESTIYKYALTNLESSTQYFYKIIATSRNGETIDSGLLTFSTAVKNDEPFSFAVVGDTEARPHVNNKVAKLIWDERPNFLVNLGDLTDGGKEHHKFEWNYEYFAGMTQLVSRIPVFPVPGNGESDLYWYNRYHYLPDHKDYYSFTYGNAEFFMLNSNRKEDFKPSGAQYKWLEEKLKNSTAKWKFVAHHHAPYSSDEDDYGNSWEGQSDLGDSKVRAIVPLYEKYGVDMVFFGHLHTYQRTMPIQDNKVNEKNGVIYVQGGGGGGNLEDFAPTRAWFSAKTYRGHHYFTITINGGSLDFKMYDSDGRMKDFLTLKK